MSSFGYNQLQEDGFPPAVAQGSHDHKSSALTSRTHLESLQVNEEAGSQAHRPEPVHDHRSENVRYTALRPTSVRELCISDVELGGADPDGTDSSILVTVASDKKKSIPKIYTIICCLLIACLVLLAFVLIYVLVVIPANKETNDHPDPRVQSEDTVKNFDQCVAKTSCGLVQGTKEDATCVFKGIPYAVPPLGARRWKSPIGIDIGSRMCLQGTYMASNYSNKCVQPSFEDNLTVEGSEDCLYLNVWTPASSQISSLPVMVWFHSGDFVYGSGNMPVMSPNSQTAAATNSVYVSFNYRLGAFGFLAVDELREEAGGAAGNYGFMDQQLVLKWVKRNIRQFGGNENLITIFGHGSGATSVHAMLLSPGSKGLFHRAWLTDPVAVLNKTVDDACRDNRPFLKSSGCSSAECLRKLPPDKVSRSSPWQLQPHWTLGQLFGSPRNGQIRNDLPIFDGHVIKLPSEKTRPDGPIVPVIFGSSYFDLSSLETIQDVVNMTWEEYDKLMIDHVGALSPDVVTRANSLYSSKHRSDYTIPENFPSTPSVQFLHLLGDIKNVCPMKIIAGDFVSLYPISSPAYMYVADVYPSGSIKLASSEKNTFVGWDVVAFFNTFHELDFLVGQWELNFQNVIREEVLSFIRSGQPDASRWRTVDVNFGVIGHDVTVTPVTSEYFTPCDLWEQYGFFKYSWREVKL